MSTSVTVNSTVAVAGQPAGRGRASRTSPFRIFFATIIFAYVVVLLLLVVWGGAYYSTPLAERHLLPQHRVFKSSGAVGHTLGIVGTLMMLFIFVYSLYKRSKILQKFGTQAQWLRVHIFLGLAGPILVTFHTTGKLGGIVAVAFYSMWAMVISGVAGRYLYAKIPRTMQGNKMTLKEIESQLEEMVEALRFNEKKREVLEGIEGFLARTRLQKGGLFKALAHLMLDDLRLPLNAYRVWHIVGKDQALSLKKRSRISRLVLRQQRLLNHLAILDASQRLFSYWHVFHKPFTVITFVIVFLHAAVALYWGYGLKW